MLIRNFQECQQAALNLLAELGKAFSQTQAPSGVAAVDGNATQGGEYSNVQAFFAGKHWSQIDPWNLLQSYPAGAASSISFLGQAGFLHYLPLFLSCVLRFPEESGLLVNSLVGRLNTPTQAGALHWRDDFGALSLGQRRTVALFLTFLVECRSEYFVPLDEEIDVLLPARALQGFWAQFLP